MSSQEFTKLVHTALISITYILYNDANANLYDAFGEDAVSWRMKLENIMECYNLTTQMKFKLPLVYTRKYYNRLTQRPDDWIQRIELAMRVIDNLQKELLCMIRHTVTII